MPELVKIDHLVGAILLTILLATMIIDIVRGVWSDDPAPTQKIDLMRKRIALKQAEQQREREIDKQFERRANLPKNGGDGGD